SHEHQNGVTRHHFNTGNYTRQPDTPIVDSEFTIFPPPSTVGDQYIGLLHKNEVSFEPLPEIRPRRQGKEISSSRYPPRPAYSTYGVTRRFSIHDWFDEPHFPRDQLQYLQEVGFGWFGQVVEGEAQNINPSERRSKVVVKILREDASPSQLASFLDEVQPYRDLKHPNILQLLSRCLESNPFLLIMEHCTQDMKQFLIEHRHDSELLLKGGQILSMMCDVANALQYMHEHGFISRDLAARNCFVTSSITVKLGDYGTSIQKYKDDYYYLGDIALPVRWCAPETVFCTETTIETKQLTREANV
ncbi:serine/threonine-protein kinase LMTK3-like, partial [Limulus polyphemus]|uniref:Serine/threonine-protein kinase LMTK3-like n=1 Tax=Limulus polyphemus TaxID=6850 RepID=A0ABM1C2Z2_LIMPO